MPDGWRCAFQESQLDSDEEFLLIHMEKRGDAGQVLCSMPAYHVPARHPAV